MLFFTDDMEYLEYDVGSKRLSDGDSEQVVLPKQQFYFSSTSVADAYTPPTVRHEPKKPSQLLLGPRPWGAAHRGVSDLSPRDFTDDQQPDQSEETGDVETDQNSNYTDSFAGKRTTSSFHSDNLTVPQSPKKGPGKSDQGPRSELGFSPRPESESDSILEEKSISMMAYSAAERHSPPSNDGSHDHRGSYGEENYTEEHNHDDSPKAHLTQLSSDAVNERYENSKASLQVWFLCSEKSPPLDMGLASTFCCWVN